MSPSSKDVIHDMLGDWRSYDPIIADFLFPFESLSASRHETLVSPLMTVLETYIMAERLRICTPYIEAVNFGRITTEESENAIGIPADLRQRIDLVMKYRGLPRMFLQLIIHSRLVWMTEGAEWSPYLLHLAMLESLEAPVIPVDDLC